MLFATLAIFDISPIHLLIVGVIGLLLFGRRLPEIGKNLGKGIVEFKKGLNSTGEELSKGQEDQVIEKPVSKPTITATQRPMKQIASTTDEP